MLYKIKQFFNKGSGTMLYGVSITIACVYLLLLLCNNFTLFNLGIDAQMRADILADGCAEYGRDELGNSINEEKVEDIYDTLVTLNNKHKTYGSYKDAISVIQSEYNSPKNTVLSEVTSSSKGFFNDKNITVSRKAVTKLVNSGYAEYTDENLFPPNIHISAVGYINYASYTEYTRNATNYKLILEQADISSLRRYNNDAGISSEYRSMTYFWDVLNFMGINGAGFDTANEITNEDCKNIFYNDVNSYNWKEINISEATTYANQGYLTVGYNGNYTIKIIKPQNENRVGIPHVHFGNENDINKVGTNNDFANYRIYVYLGEN